MAARAHIAEVSQLDAQRSTSLEFRALYTAYFSFAWRCLRGLGVAPGSLDDAAQDVFVIVHRRLPDFRGESSVRTWLYGIVRNVAANQRRGERRRGEQFGVPLDLPASGVDPHVQAQDRETAAFIERFVAQLDERKRDVFVLACLEELSTPEVAETLAIPINTAYTRLRNVRIELQRALSERGKP